MKSNFSLSHGIDSLQERKEETESESVWKKLHI